jgi:membrane dipeptidase
MSDWQVSERAKELHSDAFVADMTLPINLVNAPGGDLERMRKLPLALHRAGFSFVSFTVAGDDCDTVEAVRKIAHYRKFFLEHSDICVLVDNVTDVVRAKSSGKLAVGFHFQGCDPVGRDLNLVDLFYKLGIRHMLLAYNWRNFVAEGCHELGEGGLSRFGRELITEMNRIGMFVDVAHTGYRATMEAMEFSDRPVIVSHGNVWALNKHPRCYKDDQIKGIARTGGVLGLTGVSVLSGDEEASVDGYVRQIDYVAQLVGPEHVGFGFDYVYDFPALTRYILSKAERFPTGNGYQRTDIRQIETADVPRITDALLNRGYSEHDIRLVLGENWLRLMRTVWK